MQIRYTHKLSMHKAVFVKIGKFARCFEQLRLKQISEILTAITTLNKFPVHRIKITFKH